MFDLDGFEGPNEYLPALSALQYGPGFLLDRFAELVPALPVHAAGHPPGLLLVMDALGLDTPGRLAAFLIAAGSLLAPLAYAIGRAVADERTARGAGLLTAVAPSVLLFGATSADALFATAGALAAWALVDRRLAVRALGACLLALASFLAWSLLAIGAWAALLAWRRDGFRAMIALGLLCAAALAGFYLLLAALTGFDPVGTLRATEQVYRFGIADERPYWFWLTGSPVGVPAHARAAGRLARAARAGRGRRHGDRDLRRPRDRGGRRLHQGGGRADLAPVRAVRLPRGGERAARARPAPGARAARGPRAGLGAAVEHGLVSYAGRRYSTMSIPRPSCGNGVPRSAQPSRS